MPADALHYLYAVQELSFLQEGRIDKITMPENDEIVLHIRAKGGNHRLLLSANPAYPRCHLTSAALPSPPAAPAFLMLLRKHIGGASVTAILQEPFERIVKLRLLAKNELGFPEPKLLIAEIMGKYSNIILVGEDGRIIDSIKRIPPDTSSKRQVLPGLTYVSAPAQDRIDISAEAELLCLLEGFTGGRVDNFLLKRLCGLAPASIAEAVYTALGTTTADKLNEKNKLDIVAALKALYDGKKAPCVVLQGNVPKDFCYRPYATIDGITVPYPTLNEAMDAYYQEVDHAKRIAEKTHGLSVVLKNAIARAQKKLADFDRRMQEAADYEQDRLFGELITANIYRLKQGIRGFTAENYYADPPVTVQIPLQENKTPQYNAQQYYKRYAKKKKTLQMLADQAETAKSDLGYYQSILENLRLVTAQAEIDEIAEELSDAGLYKQQSGKKPKKPIASAPAHYVIDGYDVLVGHNNLQNDRITKAAKPNDVWLHAQKIHGAHVIVQNPSGNEVPPFVLTAAAKLAAYHSKAYLSDRVPVDYTLARYVYKPKGAKPGMVLYTDQKTLYVAPEKR